MFKLRPIRQTNSIDLLTSSLFDQTGFYEVFLKDLKKARREVIIESPFITSKRMNNLLPTFRQLSKRGIRVVINTKPLDEHEQSYRLQAEMAINLLQELGVLVLLTGGHHRKLAVIDRRIIWEGSLNILSQNDSCEIMRRMHSEQLANQMLAFINLNKYIT